MASGCAASHTRRVQIGCVPARPVNSTTQHDTPLPVMTYQSRILRSRAALYRRRRRGITFAEAFHHDAPDTRRA